MTLVYKERNSMTKSGRSPRGSFIYTNKSKRQLGPKNKKRDVPWYGIHAASFHVRTGKHVSRVR